MTVLVQTFTCARCNRGEFRSLPGLDGKAFCPWCGDAVTGGVATPPPALPPAPAPAPPPAVSVPEAPLVDAGIDQLLDRVGRTAPEELLRALRARIAEMSRACEEAGAELRRELEKKQEIKRAVMEEVGRLGSQLGDTKTQLHKKDDERRSVLAELGRAKEELERERKQGAEAATLREGLAEKERTLGRLEAELEDRRSAGRDLLESRDAARREIEQLRAELAKLKAASEAELAEQRKKVAGMESRLGTLKLCEAELADLRPKIQDSRRRLEKERGEFQEKVSGLQAELDKRDQRIRDLQLLIKTLGERLNDLTSRRV